MNFSRLLISVAVLSISIVGRSQSQFGIFGGPQLTYSKYSINSIRQESTPKFGFQLGAGWKIPFEERLSFSPAAFYSLKGYKVDFNRRSFPPDTLATNNNTTFHTMELAFLLQLDLGKKPGHFFVKAGPSLDFQLAGREKFSESDTVFVDRKLVFDFGNYGRVGASMLVHFGYEAPKGFFVFAQYTHGIGSINNADNGPLIRHRAVGISVGKYFGKRQETGK
jgi:hypothetical protein